MSDSQQNLITRAYDGFNRRDIDSVLALMTPEVDWPNGMEGGRVRGHEEVRAYWVRQFAVLDPHVEPVSITAQPDGRVAVRVHQVVRDLSGHVVVDHFVQHVYTLQDGLIAHMEIRESE
ncbi:MAG: nuclear transport factor 2 family protein [Acidobacteriaceae bacterium]|nr:nuclear transport factor 2 family protein [Acidobacteriaceae bacterium]